MEENTYFTRLQRKLEGSLRPIFMEIKDDSARHIGHAGHDPRGETHFIVTVVSDAFEGLSKVERHRLVYAAVSEEMAERVHALSLRTLSPKEYHNA
jgi:BolA family transcriptional regulator, general stress-responsive regulator